MSRIVEVMAGSPAERAGIRPGMSLVSANGSEIADIIEWKKALAEPNLLLTLLDEEGRSDEVRVLHPSGTDIGLVFEHPTVDCLKQCRNNCLFCFVRQMPRGQRSSLYVRDDDYRLSLVFGSYVTLTNVDEDEWARILREKISPIYVSVHTTNPDLRARIMGNPGAARIMTQLRQLTDAGISVQTQLVLIPGINDGAELARSLADLSAMYPGVESVAVVPVGLTGHRAGLPQITGFDRASARAVLRTALAYGRRLRRQTGESVVYLADEFFVLAEADFPNASYYDNYAQLENGVGLCRLLTDEFGRALAAFGKRPVEPRPVLWLTGESSARLLRSLQHRINLRLGADVDVLAVPNMFFGGRVSVTGLLTGDDITRALRERQPYIGTRVLVPAVALRDGLFLDGVSLKQLQEAFAGLSFEVCPIDGAQLVRRTVKSGGEV